MIETASTRAFRVVSGEPSPRFLGMTAAERNNRVALRAQQRSTRARTPSTRDDGKHAGEKSTSLPTLAVPAGVIITPALVDALPPPGMWHLKWDQTKPPIVWSGSDAVQSNTIATLQLPAGWALDVSSAAARRRSAWQLLRASGKKTDRWFARHVHRRISRLFSYVLLHLGATPNVATFLTFLVGVVSAWLLAQTTHQTLILGALIFWFSSIADGIDGEIARLTLSESEWGETLDTAVDRITYLVGYFGLMIGCWRQGLGAAGWALTGIVLMGVPLLLLWAARIERRARGTAAHVFVDKPIEVGVADAAAKTGAAALWLAARVFALFRRESFSVVFFLVSLLTAQRIVFPAIVAAGVVFVALTLLLYRRPIEQALHARFIACGHGV